MKTRETDKREISSSGSKTDMSYLCNDWDQWARTLAKPNVAPVLANESASSLPEVQHHFLQEGVPLEA